MGLFRATVDLDFPVGAGGGTNTWHLRTLSTDGTTTEVAALMTKVKNFYTAIRSLLSVSWVASWDGLVQQVATPEPRLLEGATPWSVNGQIGGSTYSASANQAVVTWRSSLATRRGRGRTFIGPLDKAAIQDDGTLDDGMVSTLRGAAQALVSGSLNDGDGGIVVFSELDQVGRDFVAASVSDQVAVLRSRRG